MKLKCNIALKILGLISSLVVFILGIINIATGKVNELNIVMIIFSFISLAFYLAEWFFTKAWFRIAYWVIFAIVNPIMLMDEDKTRVDRNINTSFFIFSIFYTVIMVVSVVVLVYQYTKKDEIKEEALK